MYYLGPTHYSPYLTTYEDFESKWRSQADQFLSGLEEGIGDLTLDGKELLESYLNHQALLSTSFSKFLIKMIERFPYQLEVILLQFHEEQRSKIASFSVQYNLVGTYEKLKTFHLKRESIEGLKQYLGGYFVLEHLQLRFEKKEVELKAVLKHIHVLTQKAPLPPSLLKILETNMDQCLCPLNSKAVLEWVQTLNKYPSSITYELIHRIHLKVRSFFPQLQRFFSEPNKLLLKGEGFDELIKDYPLSPHIIIYPAAESSNNLKSLFKKYVNTFDLKKAFFPIVSSFYHFSLLYIEKDCDSKLRVFMCDPLGDTTDAARATREILKTTKNACINDIYFLKTKRISTDYVCSQFILNDILEIIKIDSFFDILNKDPEIEKIENFIDSHPLYRVVSPPAGMMKMTQSLTKTKKYVEKTGQCLIQNTGLEVLKHHAEDLSCLIEEVSIFENVGGTPKKRNKFAFWTLSRCFEILLRKAFLSN